MEVTVVFSLVTVVFNLMNAGGAKGEGWKGWGGGGCGQQGRVCLLALSLPDDELTIRQEAGIDV